MSSPSEWPMDAGDREAVAARDLAWTLAAFRVRPWQAVLLAPRSKKPRGRHWRVTRDGNLIAQHVQAGGNVGLLTHQRTGLAVLDADHLLPWADMIEALGQPAACWVETGRARLHYYVQWLPDLPATFDWLGEPIGEIQRGPGQQMIVCPPSIHPDTGLCYRWLVDPATQPLLPLPDDWRAYLWSSPIEARS